MAETREAASPPVAGVEICDRVAVVSLRHPPVNALSRQMRAELLALMDALAPDPAVDALVIRAAGPTFIAGADIREFDGPLLDPSLPDVLAAIEGMPKPVVAAIGGAALGGGAELALACHARLASPRATLGWPEVTLGIIPGATGIERLVRLIDPVAAMDLIASGRIITAGAALGLGLVEAVVADDALLPSAVARAQALAGGEIQRASQQSVRPHDPEAVRAAGARWLAKARDQESIRAAVECVETSLSQSFEASARRSRDTFLTLRRSPQAQALRHLFFAEREARHVPGVDLRSADRVERVGVIGAGTMGTGIATACLAAGQAVCLVDQQAAVLERGRAQIADNLGRMARGRDWSEDEVAQMLARLTTSGALEDVRAADLVIEAVFEDEGVKAGVIGALGAVLAPDTLLATNTSYLDIDRLARAYPRPEQVVGIHFFAPAHIMRLVEVVRTDAASPRSLATALAFARRLGKLPIVAKVCDGFIVNSILAAYRREMEYVLEDGALPEAVDAALEAFGMAMGPFAVADMSGLDIAWARRQRRAATRPPGERYVPVADQLCEAGRLGRKTGAGWYAYKDGKRQPDPVVERLIRAASAARGIGRVAIAPQEIVRRALAAMGEEAQRLLAEGIALRASDIDLAVVHGLGFPAWRGGPLFHIAPADAPLPAAEVETARSVRPAMSGPPTMPQREIP